MTCQKCGAPCHGPYCKDCGRDRHREQALNPDKNQSEPSDQLVYECTSEGCGVTYKATSFGKCPECNGHRARCLGKATEVLA